MRGMNLESIVQSVQSEVSQKEKQILHIEACILNLERWHWWIYFQGSNGETDIENRSMDTAEGEEGEDET